MIKQNKAIELRLYPTKEQQILLNKTFGCCRKVYNLALAEAIESYKQTGKFTHRWYTAYKEEYPFLNEVEAQALNQSLQTAFKNRFSRSSHFDGYIRQCEDDKKQRAGFSGFLCEHY